MNNLQEIQGVTFENTNDYGRGELREYGYKPSPIFRNKALPVDVQGLKSEDRRLVRINGVEISSKYTIGFEIEKNRLHRGALKEYPLFCGFEKDSSCGTTSADRYGYEAVTHILPLLPKSLWRTKVFNMFKEAEKVIDDRYSPSNHRCGGHITIAVDDMTGAELMDKVRKYSGIVYAIFRKRLNAFYCKGNPQMLPEGANGIDTNAGKYSIAKDRGASMEFRLPSRFSSVKQTIRRYELMMELVDAAVNGIPYASFIRKVKPILLSMYEGDAEKVDRLIVLAKHFQKFILTGKVTPQVVPYLEGWGLASQNVGRFARYYNRTLKQMTTPQHSTYDSRGYRVMTFRLNRQTCQFFDEPFFAMREDIF